MTASRAGITARTPAVVRSLPAWAAAVGLAALGGWGSSQLDLSGPALIMFATAAVCALPVAYRLLRREFDPFEPSFIFALGWIAMFVVRPAAMRSQHNYFWSQAGHSMDVRSTFNGALVLGLLGAVGFVLGYASPLGSRLAARARPAATELDDSRLIAVAVGCCVIGTAMFGVLCLYVGGLGPTLHLLSTGRSQALKQVFQATPKYIYFGISLLAPASVMLFALGFARRRRALVVAGVGALIPFLAFAYPTGDRTFLLPLGGSLVLYYYLARSRRPSGPVIVALLVVGLFASSYFEQFRAEAAGGSTSASSHTLVGLATHPKQLLEPLTSGADASEFPALAGALLVVPSHLHFQYGTALISDLLVRPIPRALWPGKPRPPREQVISALFPAQYASGQGLANPEFSAVLIFFLDFGPLGCALGLFCYGVAGKALYAYFRTNHGALLARLVLAISVPIILEAVRDSPVDTFSHYAVFVGPVLLAYKGFPHMLTRRSRGAGTSFEASGALRAAEPASRP